MSLRTDKISSLLQKEISSYLLELELPAMVTVSRVETSPDLRHARTFITILPSDPKTESRVIKILQQSKQDLQHYLNKKLTIKFVPVVAFKVDYSQEYASHINQLLKKAHEEPETDA